MRELSEITGALKAMPPLPHVAQRVLQVVRDPEYSIDELVELVRTDPALTGAHPAALQLGALAACTRKCCRWRMRWPTWAPATS
jgi:hypothetical protein